MKINSNNLLSITEANQNFSRVAHIVDERGSVIILKNNVPQYVVLPFREVESYELMPDEDFFRISDRLMEENRDVYKELAK